MLRTILAILAVQALGATAFIYSGAFNVAATDPHWPVTTSIIETARLRSIRAHAAAIKVPSDLDAHRRVVAGTSHFAEHCSSCHSAPGVGAGEAAMGMYPQPPVLKAAARRWSSGEMFWIIRNGIKMSGMPSWPSHSDEDIWNIVAFLQRLADMTEQDYASLVKETIATGGHRAHGSTPPGQGQDCAPEHRSAGHC